MRGKATDDEIKDLIEKKANKHDVPAELLFEIYEAEREVVNMERRGSIHKDIRSLLEEFVEAEEK